MRITSDNDPATYYAQQVVARRIVAGPHVRAQCQRHLNDLKDGHKRGLEWRLPKAMRALKFYPDVLRLPEIERDEISGEERVDSSRSEPFNLHISQQFIVGSIYGWYNADGTRRFRVAYVEEGKGNGKSPLAGGIGLYMQNADGKQNAEVYAAAAIKDQAKIQYRDAVNMVDASEDLSELIQKHGEKEVYNLVNRATNSFFKPISAEKRGLDGKRVHCALIDELHEHTSSIVADKMRAGTKGSRNALIFEITNSGVDKLSICYQHHEYSIRVVNGETIDDAWFAYVCGMDEGDDPFKDEKCWVKANPLLGVSITLRYLRELVNAAKGMPSQESIVRRLNFCQWVGAENPWISQELWLACESPEPFGTEVEAKTLNAVPYIVLSKSIEPIGALDLSGSRDLTALALLWPPGTKAGIRRAKVEFWTPKDTLIDRARKERVPYDVWVDQGFMVATPGRAVDYGFVAHRLVELNTETGLRRVAFDPYRIKYLEKELDELGSEITLIPHGQGYYKAHDKKKEDGDEEDGKVNTALWMPRSVELLESHVSAGRLCVLKSPPLTYCSASAVLEADPKNNRIFTKRKSKGRIDGIVALAMVCGLEEISVEETPMPGIVLL